MNLENINSSMNFKQYTIKYIKYSLLLVLLVIALNILIPEVHADYIISASDGNVNIYFDTNTDSVPTMNLNIVDFNVLKGYTNYTADFTHPTVNPIILGLEFIMLLFGIMLALKSITMFGNKNP
jgi:hypothetical protein